MQMLDDMVVCESKDVVIPALHVTQLPAAVDTVNVFPFMRRTELRYTLHDFDDDETTMPLTMPDDDDATAVFDRKATRLDPQHVTPKSTKLMPAVVSVPP